MRSRSSSGFTFIEMMLVISIIALLASIILAALFSAKAKAEDAATISQVHQFQTAFALAADNTPDNPYPNPGDTSNYYCVGKSPSDSCKFFDQTWHGNDAVNTALNAPNFASIASPQVVINQVVFQGAVYKCTTLQNGGCTGAAIYWPQVQGTTCVVGQVVFSGPTGVVCGQDVGSTGTQYVELPPASFAYTLSTTLPPPSATMVYFFPDAGVTTVQVTATVTKTAGNAQAVSLSSQGASIPSGYSVGFENNSCSPNSTCNILMDVSTTQPAGTFATFPALTSSPDSTQKTTSFFAKVCPGRGLLYSDCPTTYNGNYQLSASPSSFTMTPPDNLHQIATVTITYTGGGAARPVNVTAQSVGQGVGNTSVITTIITGNGCVPAIGSPCTITLDMTGSNMGSSGHTVMLDPSLATYSEILANFPLQLLISQ